MFSWPASVLRTFTVSHEELRGCSVSLILCVLFMNMRSHDRIWRGALQTFAIHVQAADGRKRRSLRLTQPDNPVDQVSPYSPLVNIPRQSRGL